MFLKIKKKKLKKKTERRIFLKYLIFSARWLDGRRRGRKWSQKISWERNKRRKDNAARHGTAPTSIKYAPLDIYYYYYVLVTVGAVRVIKYERTQQEKLLSRPEVSSNLWGTIGREKERVQPVRSFTFAPLGHTVFSSLSRVRSIPGILFHYATR